MEHFLVENDEHEKACYEFTSVGAFTTAHTNKLNIQKPIETLKFFDKPFNFQPVVSANASEPRAEIENEALLGHFTLKILIEIGQKIKHLIDQKAYSAKVFFFSFFFCQYLLSPWKIQK